MEPLARRMTIRMTSLQCAAWLAASSTAMALPLVAEAKPLFCQQPYALCSMAKCIPSTTEPNKLSCFCRTLMV